MTKNKTNYKNYLIVHIPKNNINKQYFFSMQENDFVGRTITIVFEKEDESEYERIEAAN